MSCVVGIEGFYVSGQYIVKELTFLFSKDSYQHFMFNTPRNLFISKKDKRTVSYTEKLNGLELTNDCFLPYELIEHILEKIGNLRIYTAGNQAKIFLRKRLPYTLVIDICQKYNFTYPRHLPPASCFKPHPSRYCSLAKAFAIKKSLDGALFL